MTGAPKLRSVKLLEEIEELGGKRGVYSGMSLSSVLESSIERLKRTCCKEEKGICQEEIIK